MGQPAEWEACRKEEERTGDLSLAVVLPDFELDEHPL